nr:MAG TPA: putative ATP-dependent endonuclease of the OLD family [Caudoviricetes sp.]
MFIKSMKISNFQCFSEVPVDIDFEKDITCLIGNNGAGKTSILKAIQKVFGNTTDERTIFKSDFHVATGETDLQNRQLYIDIVFEFLDKDEVKTLAFFSPVIYESKNKTFQARMRLEALWNEDEYEDDVSSTLFWVLTDEDVDFGDETPLKIKVENHERRQINLIYVPATRNAKSILNIELKRIIKKIERYADISETDRLAIENDSKVLGEKVNAITAVQSIQTAINNVWNKIHDSSLPHYGNIKLEIISNKFEDLVKSLILKLFPSETEDLKDINELSDGQISLLYLTLSMALYEIEVQHENNKLSGLKEQDYDAPIFTIFALEEPENHLSPFYLSRIIDALEDKSKSNSIISIVTSHSPNVVRRLNKVEQIRFLRQECCGNDRKTISCKILLPENKDEEDYKYLNQAVLSHPEIYFSKLVVLGEGDSEEIVLPVIAQKKSCNFDTSFVSFVPLAGRHVNHMWRLLNELKIPYVTLLDYDLGRYGGGEKRLFEISEKLGLPKTSTKGILEEHNVFFSYPLDFDMLMITAFPDFYIDNGQDDEHDKLVKSVLGKNGDESKYVAQNNFFTDELLRKYRYLFKTKSKVASHYLICDKIKNMELSDFEQKCPTVLHRLINKACDILKKSHISIN